MKNKIMLISVIVIIIAGILSSIWYGFDIYDRLNNKGLFDKKNNDILNIDFEPKSINEGQYKDGIPIKIKISNLRDNNITSLTLSRNNVVVNRLNKNSQTQVSSISWEKSYNDNYIFYQDKYNYNNMLEASGKLWGCDNCFMGEQSPYEISLTIIYKIGDGNLITEIKKFKIDII